MRRSLFLSLTLLTAAIAISCTTMPSTRAGWHGPETAGSIETPLINEASGLAPSHRQPGVFWINNDSGGEPVLHAIDAAGRYLGSVRITGATNVDWEDAASFELDGQAYLLAADVGDNRSRRTDCRLYIVREPDPAMLNPDRELSAGIAWSVPVAYPDGPRDCEAVAVDATTHTVYLISKRTVPPVVYQLPLEPGSAAAAPVAAVVGDLNGILQPTGPNALIKAPWGKFRAQPCAFDISSDGRTAVVLTYGELHIYRRTGNTTWAQAFAAAPAIPAGHGLPQAESACFTIDGTTVMVTTEGFPAPLLRYRQAANP